MAQLAISATYLYELELLREEFRRESSEFYFRNNHRLTLICEHTAPTPGRGEWRLKFDAMLDGNQDPEFQLPSEISQGIEGIGSRLQCIETFLYAPKVGSTGVIDDDLLRDLLAIREKQAISSGTEALIHRLQNGLESDETERRMFINFTAKGEYLRFDQLCKRGGRALSSLPKELPLPEELLPFFEECWNSDEAETNWRNALVDTAVLDLPELGNAVSAKIALSDDSNSYLAGLPDVYLASADFLNWIITLATNRLTYKQTKARARRVPTAPNAKRDEYFRKLADAGKDSQSITAAWNRRHPLELLEDSAVRKAISRHRQKYPEV